MTSGVEQAPERKPLSSRQTTRRGRSASGLEGSPEQAVGPWSGDGSGSEAPLLVRRGHTGDRARPLGETCCVAYRLRSGWASAVGAQ